MRNASIVVLGVLWLCACAGPRATQPAQAAEPDAGKLPPSAAATVQAGQTATVTSPTSAVAGSTPPAAIQAPANLAGSSAGTAAGSSAGTAAGSSAGTAAGSSGAGQPPAAVTDPALGPTGLGSVGVAVNDLDKAADFFVQNFDMKVNTPAIERDDRTERVLAYDNNNTTLTLMKYKDGRMIVGCYDVNACSAKNVPGKIVFSAQTPSATGQKVVAAGFSSVLNAGTIVQVSAIDDYLIEILQGDPAVIALAIAVTEFDKANDFYTMAFGLSSTGTYNDARMSGLQEAFFADPAGGAAVVIQHYTQGEWTYKDNPMKTLWRVADAGAALMKVISMGGSMVSPPAPLPAFNNKPTAIAKDADGYLLELVQK